MTQNEATMQAIQTADQIGAGATPVKAQVIATIMLAQAIGRIATVIEDMATEAKKEQAKPGRK